MKIGVLALQGAFFEHKAILDKLKIDSTLVKTKDDLDGIDGIILPGGESTAMGKLLREFDMLDKLRDKIKAGMPAFGTCAGMILLAKKLSNDSVSHLALMDITVKRNAYGRQLSSFSGLFPFKGIERDVNMVFIRAPFIEEVAENVDVLSIVNENIVAARQDNMLAISFHPELTEDVSVHEYFISMVKEYKKN